METGLPNPFESFGAALRLVLHALLAVLGVTQPTQAAEVRQFLEEFEAAQIELAALLAQFRAGTLPAADAPDPSEATVAVRAPFIPIFSRFWVCLIAWDLCPLRGPDDLIFQKWALGVA